MSRSKQGAYSIHQMIRELSSKLKLYGLALFTLLSLINATAILHGSHTAICALAQSKLDQLSGPLGRELIMGNEATSGEVFSNLKGALGQLGMSENLTLNRVVSDGSQKLYTAHCEAGLFRATLQYPIHFANQNLALISGSISYFSAIQLVMTLVVSFLLLTLALKIGGAKITLYLKSRVMDPIRALSQNRPLPNGARLLIEVSEIEENIIHLKADIQEKERINFSLQKTKEIAKLAEQMAHDIGSPLTALEMLARTSNFLPEDERVILRTSVARVQSIVNDVRFDSRRKLGQEEGVSSLIQKEAQSGSPQLLSSLISVLISEKRMQYRSKIGVEIEIRVDTASYGIFAKVDPIQFNRALSNLINNAVEALDGSGTVTIALTSLGSRALLLIEDNGKGIEPDVLPQLGEKGGTFGKPGGSGLGIYSAREAINSWGGTLLLKSEPGEGTQVTISIPKMDPPIWFVPEIQIQPKSSVVVLDDDSTIHQVWALRFKAFMASPESSGAELLHFSSSGDIRKWFNEKRSDSNPVLYLCDYELLGDDITGLDLIEQLGIAGQSILVTSRTEDGPILERCEKLGLRLLPKELASLIPISLSSPKSRWQDTVAAWDLFTDPVEPSSHLS